MSQVKASMVEELEDAVGDISIALDNVDDAFRKIIKVLEKLKEAQK